MLSAQVGSMHQFVTLPTLCSLYNAVAAGRLQEYDKFRRGQEAAQEAVEAAYLQVPTCLGLSVVC